MTYDIYGHTQKILTTRMKVPTNSAKTARARLGILQLEGNLSSRWLFAILRANSRIRSRCWLFFFFADNMQQGE